jgi:uncharacterized protein (TIGR02145 family)
MNKNRKNSLQIILFALMGLFCQIPIFGQIYQIGDLYTFDDGSQGIIFYINPDNPTSGTVAALNDLDGKYAVFTGNSAAGMVFTNVFNLTTWSNLSAWPNHGKSNTLILLTSGLSPAAAAVDVSNGWYLPEIFQLRRLIGLYNQLQPAFERNGGNISNLLKDTYISSSVNNLVQARLYYYALRNDFTLYNYDGKTANRVRAVRDFPDNPRITAYWADNPPNSDTVVSPESTTLYDAIVIYRSDTIQLSSTVTVHIPATDTLYETTQISSNPYNSSAGSTFTNIDVSLAGNYIYKKATPSEYGCDDTMVLHLTVLPLNEFYDTVSICLYEDSQTLVYEGNDHVFINVFDNSITITSSSENILIEEVTENSDYTLKMKSSVGGDSLIYLHLQSHQVIRDTVYYEIEISQIADNELTVCGYTLRDITGSGTYTFSDTLMASDGCDSIVVMLVIVNACVSDIAINCPPAIYKTLAYGDCAIKIYPEEHGPPSIAHSADWPIVLTNDIPADSLFFAGEHLITWIASDTVCCGRDTCTQRIVITYPQCPDAVDCEGNIYHGVRIGCDCWTQRNLESTQYSDCTEIPNVYSYASFLHPDTAENVAIFGRLYSFEAAVRDSADNGHGHIQGICPDGWYLPTPEKYEGLNAYGANALKSTQHWYDGRGDNSTGFTALPAGFYNGVKNRYEGLLTEAYFWSTQETGSGTAKHSFTMAYECDLVLQESSQRGLGYSVRCIKEKE